MENKDQLKIEYLDFSYAILNPDNLIGVSEFNQSFFDKIDEIEVEIANGNQLENILSNLGIIPIKITNFRFSLDKKEIEKKIFEKKDNKIDIFENKDDYILYEIEKIEEREPDLSDSQIKKEITELIYERNKFDYNRDLLSKISNNNFNNEDFLNMGQNSIETLNLNSIKDNKKFEINAVEALYSMPIDSFTLINDNKNNIYLAKIKKFNDKSVKDEIDKNNEYKNKLNSNLKTDILKSYDLFLNDKYEVNLNQKTIERVKNFFQ